MKDSARNRIVGYDLARAIAILGMVVHHFVMAMAAEEKHPRWLGRLLEICDGRPAALFLILAGIGLSLRSKKAAGSNDANALHRERQVITRRGILLLVIGFFNLIIWPGDILRVYGISMLLAAHLLHVPSRRLLIAAASFIVGFGILFVTVNYEQNWDWPTLTYHHLWTVSGAIRNLFYDGFRAVFPWTGFLLFGMWLGRMDLSQPDTSRRCLKIGLLVFLTSEFISWMLLRAATAGSGLNDGQREELQFLCGTGSMPPLPLFLAAAGGFAVAVIIISIQVAEHWPDRFSVQALVATGQMALSWYFLHIYSGLGTLVALNQTGKHSLSASAVTGVGFFLAAVLVSWCWKRTFTHGPLEWLMRRAAG